MKSLKLLLFSLLLLSISNLSAANLAILKFENLKMALDDCSLSSAQIAVIQTALADYEDWSVSYVVNSTYNVSVETCDGSLPMSGVITLEIDEELYSWNWERQGGGNIIIIWPA